MLLINCVQKEETFVRRNSVFQSFSSFCESRSFLFVRTHTRTSCNNGKSKFAEDGEDRRSCGSGERRTVFSPGCRWTCDRYVLDFCFIFSQFIWQFSWLLFGLVLFSLATSVLGTRGHFQLFSGEVVDVSARPALDLQGGQRMSENMLALDGFDNFYFRDHLDDKSVKHFAR